MKLYFPVFILVIVAGASGCKKSAPERATNSDISATDTGTNRILVDASKDGGVWWFPQGSGFSETEDHQGKALADYLRALGYEVDELPRGTVITSELLSKYDKIIRGPTFYHYSNDELTAYKEFFKKSGTILLLQDHLSYQTNDEVSEYLGVQFRGAVNGIVTNFASSEIMDEVTPLSYIAGSVVVNAADNPNILVLGWMKSGEYAILNNGDPFNGEQNLDAPVMGLVNNYPNTRIMFIGDTNGIEMLPQPFTQNVVSWLIQ